MSNKIKIYIVNTTENGVEGLYTLYNESEIDYVVVWDDDDGCFPDLWDKENFSESWFYEEIRNLLKDFYDEDYVEDERVNTAMEQADPDVFERTKINGNAILLAVIRMVVGDV